MAAFCFALHTMGLGNAEDYKQASEVTHELSCNSYSSLASWIHMPHVDLPDTGQPRGALLTNNASNSPDEGRHSTRRQLEAELPVSQSWRPCL